jgi:hypothetical protein
MCQAFVPKKACRRFGRCIRRKQGNAQTCENVRGVNWHVGLGTLSLGRAQSELELCMEDHEEVLARVTLIPH